MWGNGFTPKVIWSIVKEGAANCGLLGLAPHDLCRTCARLCHQAGGELEQIQFLLGHVSIETTERYLGCKQRFQNAVNDAIGLDSCPYDASTIRTTLLWASRFCSLTACVYTFIVVRMSAWRSSSC